MLALRADRSAYGDLWMYDAGLDRAVRGLEDAGMSPPRDDLQDYFSVLLNRCRGEVVGLRVVMEQGEGKRMCLGFDFADQLHPEAGGTNLEVRGGRLHCRMQGEGRLEILEVAEMSFTAVTFEKFLRDPGGIFRTTMLWQWARSFGVLVPPPREALAER